ncbi:hypothetical protein JCM11641_006264 [Rhodosporidiobolus odoratus]
MNDRQVDELTALEAIYPDTVSWMLADERVLVQVSLPIDLEEEREVEVWDRVAPSLPAPLAVEDAAEQLRTVTLGRGEEASQARVGNKPGRGRRKRGRGGKAATASVHGGQGKLAADATPFRPHSQSHLSGNAQSATGPAGSTPRPVLLPPPVVPKSPPPSSPLALSPSDTAPRIRFTPRPPTPPPAALPLVAASTEAEPIGPKRLRLRYLPALELEIRLGAGYPETEGPENVSLTDEQDWLGESRRKAAEVKMRDVYAGEECLFPLLDLVQSSSPSFLSTFSVTYPLTIRQSLPPAAPSSVFSASSEPLSKTLRLFNHTSSATAFSTSSFACTLCFSTRRGSSCIRLSSCSCVFCIPCLRDYFSLLITEGLVRSVACPGMACVKERATWEKKTGAGGTEEDKPGAVTGEEVERLVGEEGRKRWEWLKEKVRVERDPTIAFCPIASCQAAVPKIEDEEKLRISYSFCLFCRKAWHGARNACALPQSSAIVTAYLEGSPTERQGLEARYGASNLKRLVQAYEEEKALQEWLEENATRCPGCDVPIQKSHGCNHVTCAKCSTHFCYRCGKSISPTDPYKHFSTPGGRCYGHLFDFSPGQEPRVEDWIGEILDEEGGH